MPEKLKDCRSSEAIPAELLIVEGDSACSSVDSVRDKSFQAVLPIQGKPLNPIRANRAKVAEHPFYQAIVGAIGAGWDEEFDLSKSRYERVVLVFDPDADGIHCSMLVLMFFYRWMRPLLEAGRVHLVRAPLVQITFDGASELICTDDEDFATREVSKLKAAGKTNVVKKRFRGLGSMSPDVLAHYCVNPGTRQSNSLTIADAEAAIAVFSPQKRL
ncbi:MAG: toprim domain-containing protein [Pirellulales bacterium]